MLKHIFIFLIFLCMTIILIPQAKASDTIWKYQCIDTMKTSRDNARRWKDDPKLSEYIYQELDAIVDM